MNYGMSINTIHIKIMTKASNYLVDEKKWLHNLRRLEVLVQNYAFGDFSLDIPFAFKTLGVLPNSKSKYMYGQLVVKQVNHNKIVMFGILFNL